MTTDPALQERALIVGLVRKTAADTNETLRSLHRKHLLTPAQTIRWEQAVETLVGLAAAIQRGEHKDQNDG